jgi:hypothetical protein
VRNTVIRRKRIYALKEYLEKKMEENDETSVG